MKPLPSFTLHRPRTLQEALTLLQEPNAKPIAGGTDLVPLMRDGAVTPSLLVDISQLMELKHIREEKDQIHIGATTTLRQIQLSELITEKASILAEAAGCMGSPQIRNLGTLGGNLCNASPAADMAPPFWHSTLQRKLPVSTGREVSR